MSEIEKTDQWSFARARLRPRPIFLILGYKAPLYVALKAIWRGFFITNKERIDKLLEMLKTRRSYEAVYALFESLRFYQEEVIDPKTGRPVTAYWAHQINQTVVQPLTAACLRDKETFSTADRSKFAQLYPKSLEFSAPVLFDSYLQWMEWDRDPEKRFYLPRQRVLRPVVADLQRLADDELDMLSISMPPGTGKSTLGIFFLTFLMGKDPSMPNLASGHSDKLTRSFYNGVTGVITDNFEYKFNKIFPEATVAYQNAKDEVIDLKTQKRFNTLTCRSIDGSLTGATRCEGLLYADDLVSGIEEALSLDRMNNLWQKYTNDLKSRKKLGCKELHIATRWSIHDVIGRLERQYGNDPRYKFITMPALNDKDESNFNYDHGVGFDTKYFHDMRDALDDASWRSLYMNEPIEREGLLFAPSDFKTFFELPGEPDTIVSVCDTKDGGADSVAMPIAYKYGDLYYIPDLVFNNTLPEVHMEQLAQKLVDHVVKQSQFESNSAGGQVADQVQKKVKEKGGHTHITKKWTTANKVTKIIVNSAFIKEHFYFRDPSTYTPQSEYGRFMAEVYSFTQTGKSKHDDAPDSLAQLSEYVQSVSGGQVSVLNRPW